MYDIATVYVSFVRYHYSIC